MRERRQTLLDAWVNRSPELTIELLTERVSWRLANYDQDNERVDKNKYLGTLGNWIKNQNWINQGPPPPPRSYAWLE